MGMNTTRARAFARTIFKAQELWNKLGYKMKD
jgi:hypothetical protein